MKTTVINNISTTSNKPEISKRDTAKAGLCWFAVDMAVGTAADVFHNSKSKTKLTAKTLSKQLNKCFGGQVFLLVYLLISEQKCMNMLSRKSMMSFQRYQLL